MVGAEKKMELTPEIQRDWILSYWPFLIRVPGYFLIVQDFIAKAREMDVSVGPGRGSAAGSAVAYCLKN
jgi:DNA polymerase-3 subunit alpha